MNLSTERFCALPTELGEFRMYDTGHEHIRLVSRGDVRDLGRNPLLRIHSSCLASEVFGALDCDCADQLREALARIAMEDRGLIIHLHQEGRGHGLSKKIEAVHLMQTKGVDTVAAFEFLRLEQDNRRYDDAVRLLRPLGVTHVRLISNNPRKKAALELHGIRAELVHTHAKMRPQCASYLISKRDRLGHQLRLPQETTPHSAIRFYHSDQPWGELSNFSRHAICVDSRVWPTVEHFYQAQKFVGSSHEETIRRCTSPLQAKCVSRQLEGAHLRTDWPKVKEDVMKVALQAKFSQHPDLADLLLNSGDRPLIEHASDDGYWGDGGDGTGLNRLGELLMQVRSALRHPRVLG